MVLMTKRKGDHVFCYVFCQNKLATMHKEQCYHDRERHFCDRYFGNTVGGNVCG